MVLALTLMAEVQLSIVVVLSTFPAEPPVAERVFSPLILLTSPESRCTFEIVELLIAEASPPRLPPMLFGLTVKLVILRFLMLLGES